jgi:hypothetical protein
MTPEILLGVAVAVGFEPLITKGVVDGFDALDATLVIVGWVIDHI